MKITVNPSLTMSVSLGKGKLPDGRLYSFARTMAKESAFRITVWTEGHETRTTYEIVVADFIDDIVATAERETA